MNERRYVDLYATISDALYLSGLPIQVLDELLNLAILGQTQYNEKAVVNPVSGIK